MRDLGLGPWCLEIFAGTGRFISELCFAGRLLVPRIDMIRAGQVQEAIDLLGAKFFDFLSLLLLCRVGAIAFLHLGLPCSSFSQARLRHGGPGRSAVSPLGLDDLQAHERDQPSVANELLSRSLMLMDATIVAGGGISPEKPLCSLLWQVQALQQLKVRFHL